MKRLIAISKNLALVIASLLVCFILLEIVFRILAPPESPGTTYGKSITKNTDNFRDREFAIPKPEHTYRILVLGDSFTWGVGLDVEETIPKLLERQLAAGHPAGTIEVINAAIPGYNTVEQLILLQEKGLKYQPDMVLLIYNLNDIEYLPHLTPKTYDHLEATPVVELDPGEEITKYSPYQGLRGIILKIEQRSVFVKFLVPRVGALLREFGLIESVEFSWVEKLLQGFTDENPGWLESKRSLTQIAALCQNEGCTFQVGIYPLLTELERYRDSEAHRTLLRFFREAGIQATDLLPLFENTNPRSYWINFMDGHPNATAHRMVSEALLPAIRTDIQARTDG